ncbi:hypothetical protein PHPALM_11171 [Phytophthora palmivora]|uniref:Uncharacterized protein n=1 Tax=Phytophthora palmivora TaxID=4796 RepID=A0A2P4Y2Y2_9STRA|nr:hypothetical protein PHPALM_11171 [Phytophthora palmivora]
MATLLDTTMEASEPEEHADNNQRVPQSAEPETDAPEDEDDDEDFHFNAPSYYDLKNPALERRYVNNADGYFSSPVPSAATSKASPFTDQKSLSSTTDPPTTVNRTLSKYYEAEAGNNHTLEGHQDKVMEDKAMLDTTMAGPEEEEEDVETVLNRSNLLDDREESFEEFYAWTFFSTKFTDIFVICSVENEQNVASSIRIDR